MLLTTKQVAARLGIGTPAVRQLVRRGVLRSKKFGNAYAFDSAEIEAYATRRRAPGRPTTQSE